MKKFNLSLVAVLAMSTFAIAGGDIAPIEEPVVVVEPVIDNSAFYLGLGYGYFKEEIDLTGIGSIDENANTVLLQAGYEFNQYVAVEGRYWLGSDLGDIDADISSWGIYVKPQYPVSEAFNLYALLGYANTTVDNTNSDLAYLDTSDFSWGLGGEYKFSENVSVFLDYTSLGNTDEFTMNGVDLPTDLVDVSIYTVNLGVTYRF